MEIQLKIMDDATEHFSKRVSLPCVIGRSKQASVSIVHPLVSRRHCEIFADRNSVSVRDLGSLNGTFYRNQRISRGVPLAVGDYFTIGNLKFYLVDIYAETTKMQKIDFNPPAPTTENATVPRNVSSNDDFSPELDDVVDLADFGSSLFKKDES